MISSRRRGGGMVLFGLTGLSVLVASVWVFLLILKGVYGRYEVGDLLPTGQRLRAAFGMRDSDVGILASGYSEQLFPPENTWLRDNVSTWQRFVEGLDLRADVLDDRAVEAGDLMKYALVVLPGCKALSDKEIRSIKKYVDRGGSVFATSGTGSYTERGTWRGWEFLSQVFGLQFTAEITPEEATKLHTLRGGLPITAGIPTGFSLKVATWDKPMACEVVEPRTIQASTWFNFRRDAGLVREAIEKSAGIAYGTYGRGRFVWMGFELNSVLGDQKDYVNFDILCRRSVDWLMGTPTVRVRDWPASYRAAAVVIASISRDFGNARNLFGPIRSARIPITLFLDPVAAADSGRLSSSLRSYGEIGAIVPLDPAAATEEEGRQQQGESVQVRTTVAGLSGTPVSGALPAAGYLTELGMHSLVAAGYRFVVGDSITDRIVPETIIMGNRAIVAIAKTARGDDDIVGEFGLTDTSYQLYTYREDVDRVLFHGGMYVLRIHSNLQCRTEYVPVLARVVEYLRNKTFWVTSTEELTRWWLAKSSLEVSCKKQSNRRIALVISNPSSLSIQNAVIQVNINRAVERVAITSDIMGTRIPAYQLSSNSQVLDITIPSLREGETLFYFIDYDRVKS